jgi:hypothetical protein
MLIKNPNKGKTAMNDLFNPKGKFVFEQIRNGKVIYRQEFKNTVTTEGKNNILNTFFYGASGPAKINTWHIGIVDNASFTAIAATDTYDNINQAGNGWDEWVDYTDANNGDSAATRPVWTMGAASAGSITTDTPQAIFDVVVAGNGDVLKGIFICGGPDADTKADHTPGSPANVLWSVGAFTALVTVETSDQLKITYTLSC